MRRYAVRRLWLRSPCGPAVSRERLEKGELSVNHDNVCAGNQQTTIAGKAKREDLTTGTHVRDPMCEVDLAGQTLRYIRKRVGVSSVG